MPNPIKAAGMSTDGMDRKTIKFVYEFIDNYKKNNTTMGPPVASIQKSVFERCGV